MLHKGLLIRLCQARDMLAGTHDHSLSIQQVAIEVEMSPYHFIRLFKAVFGETPNQYQIHERLKRAKQLLVESDYSVTEICMDVGYSSLGTFSDLFSHRIGMTPSAYRRKFQPMKQTSSELPKQLVPCCFSLMCGSQEKISQY